MAQQVYAINVIDHVEGPGIKTRVPVKTISLVDQNLATDLTGTVISGYTLASGDRFVLANQTTTTENGIYICDTTSYRAPDYDLGDMSQCFFTVDAGTYAATEWQATGNGVVGTGAQGFVMKSIMSYSTGDIIYASSGNTLSKISAPASDSLMIMSNTGVPSYYTSLPVANGGTGNASYTAGALLLGNGTSAFNSLAPSTYKVLATDGTPSFTLTNDIHLDNIFGGSTTQKLIGFTDNVSAVNYLTLANSATNPSIGVDGTGTNVSLQLVPKGSGTVDIKAATQSRLNFWDTTYTVSLRAPTLSSNVAFILPSADGSNGQILRTNGAGQLQFGSAGVDLTLAADPIVVSNTSVAATATMCYNVSAYGSAVTATLYFEVVYNTNFTFSVYNVTGSTSLSSTAITSSGFKTVTFTTPSANARIEFRVQKTAIGTSSIIYGLQLSI